jgi:HSP20 family molecular chaperone IbpA
MALTPYLNDPLFNQIERAMDRAMGRFMGDRDVSFMPNFTREVGMPSTAHPMDIMETNDAYELTADAPGFTPSDITVGS